MSTSARPLRFGILCDSAGLEGWQQRCVELLLAEPDVLHVTTLTADGKGWLAPALEQMRTLQPDFMLSFLAGQCPPALRHLPPHGVWTYRFGEPAERRGAPTGYWEVHDGNAISQAMLIRAGAEPDTVHVLREGCLRTQLLSVAKNRAQLHARFVHWPAQVCRDLRNGVTIPGPHSGRSLRVTVQTQTAPSRGQRLACRCRILGRIARTAFRSLLRHDQWNIGIVDRPIESFLDPRQSGNIRWLPEPKRSELRADPFGLLRAGQLTILCEHFSYRDNRGFIVALGDDYANVPVRIGPVPPVHLSYPYLLQTGGRLYCMPESSESGELACYEVEQFPERWTRSHVPLALPVVDATPFEHGGYWWIAASEVAPHGANCELHLWYATDIAGPWQAHACNPVKMDIRSARPAGTPFSRDGVLYRPAQDCSTSYGARVVINEIVKLTPTEFEERPVASVDPDPLGPWPNGLHTLSSAGGLTLIDGKRSQFAPPEFMRLLAKWLRLA